MSRILCSIWLLNNYRGVLEGQGLKRVLGDFKNAREFNIELKREHKRKLKREDKG